MRPAALDPLFAPLTSLDGIGPKTVRPFARLLGRETPRVVDLLFHMPSGFVDRRARPTIAEAREGEDVTLEVRVDGHQAPPPGSRAPHRTFVSDATGDMVVVHFKADSARMAHMLPEGATRWLCGRIERYDGLRQMVHPDRVLDAAGLARLPPVEQVYPLVEGLHAGHLRRALASALGRVPDLAEWLPSVSPGSALPSFREALERLHRPQTPADAQPTGMPWRRLALDELLAHQVSLALARARDIKAGGRETSGDGRIAARLRAALPFALTGAQEQALAAIAADLAAPTRMLRLMQGDVGSGKTVVALLAAAVALEAGRQAAIMAPTEILARQHLETIAPLAQAAGIEVVLLTGREKGRARADILAGLAEGRTGLVVGTHALIQDDVAFRDLALAVVDEQHRFGVEQRLALARKGAAVDMLVMTATPIPRTLVLTLFGDMEASELREKPPGRQEIDTRAVPLDRLDEVVEAVGRAMAAGARAYWICPLVEETDTSDLAAATERFEALKARFGERVDLVHGRMSGTAKDAAMARFAAGECQLLVATTVVEVGVNVPEATIMVIEHAERFGLAQLHQLRGRVGRGDKPSTCLLLYRAPLGETAKARLAILRESQDGFRIAEEDLRLRGEGDVLGTRQSGMPGFRVARLDVHSADMETARRLAATLVRQDPGLATPVADRLRTLLYLHERDAAMRLLGAG
ncbi:ATP-dependent DNA helicase RecG [Xanthobacter tagetidis]|uniref:ATP-dependent DNA helicase RecG n=1 Tax=Xanthobacter tagetidis TaxID=60216 RepID=A0A3L7AF86_9HYPH|nr:ATP-dependent DNA helicase RecG [Xanthobacter tagetidis]MBB6309832.1 ATP-dependent DNA helicase RecG [Xanthobacter tagetidis]RLP78291.1 ATP-dependent DNA helicase RecG [Xanthobacter tagetidis]